MNSETTEKENPTICGDGPRTDGNTGEEQLQDSCVNEDHVLLTVISIRAVAPGSYKAEYAHAGRAKYHSFKCASCDRNIKGTVCNFSDLGPLCAHCFDLAIIPCDTTHSN